MSRLKGLLKQLRVFTGKARVERELDEELRIHLEMETEKNVREGMSPAAARRAALVAFGGVERTKERVREARWTRWVEDVARDGSHAGRALLKNPGFTAMVVLTLAFGTGAVTALFALVNSILIRPLPYPDANRLVAVEHAEPGLDVAETGVPDALYFYYRSRVPAFQSLALYSQTDLPLTDPRHGGERVHVTYAGPEFFRILGARPLLGRLFHDADGAPGFLDTRWSVPVLLSERLWRQRFGADSSVIGRTIELNELHRLVVGILPTAFDFPVGTDIWELDMPDSATAYLGAAHSTMWSSAIGRLRAGAGPETAQSEMARVLPGIVGRFPDATASWLRETRLQPVVVPLKSLVVGDVGGALWLLLGGMGVVLLVACANVGSLLLSRSEQRAGEIAVRSVLGARRSDLFRLFVGEALVLSTLGTALGLLVAAWGLHALVTFAPVQLPRLREVAIDVHVLLLDVALIAGTATPLALLSMMRHARARSLSPGLRRSSAGTVGRAGTRRMRAAFVAGQVALATTLLLGSALMLESFQRLMHVDPGFDARGVLSVQVGIPWSQASNYVQVYQALQDRLTALPGVRSVGAVEKLPLASDAAPDAYRFQVASPAIAGRREARALPMEFFLPGYFRTMRIGLVAGTRVGRDDATQVGRPVLVSATLAHRLFPEHGAIGQHIRRLLPVGSRLAPNDFVIVGVVHDVRQTSLRSPAQEVVYVPVVHPPPEHSLVPTEMAFVIRCDGPPLALAPVVRTAIRDLDPQYSIARMGTMASVLRASTARTRFVSVLLLIAAVTSLLLGLVGVFGTVAYAVRQRSREIGIRIAVGARPDQVTTLILRDASTTLVIGLAVGLPVAILAARAARALLFQVSPMDAPTLAGITVIVAATTLLAAWAPARRAARIDPNVSLGAE